MFFNSETVCIIIMNENETEWEQSEQDNPQQDKVQANKLHARKSYKFL